MVRTGVQGNALRYTTKFTKIFFLITNKYFSCFFMKLQALFDIIWQSQINIGLL